MHDCKECGCGEEAIPERCPHYDPSPDVQGTYYPEFAPTLPPDWAELNRLETRKNANLPTEVKQNAPEAV